MSAREEGGGVDARVLRQLRRHGKIVLASDMRFWHTAKHDKQLSGPSQDRKGIQMTTANKQILRNAILWGRRAAQRGSLPCETGWRFCFLFSTSVETALG